jgi:hypothetical protein
MAIGGRTNMIIRDNDDTKANERLQQVLKAIKSEDKDAIKALFSKKALREADDFEGSMDKLLGFFSAEITWEASSGPTVFESNDYGHQKKEVSSYYYLKTDNQNYYLLMEDFPVDTDHPDNVGLYMLLTVRAEEKEKLWDKSQKILYDGNQKISHAGIYIPLEQKR